MRRNTPDDDLRRAERALRASPRDRRARLAVQTARARVGRPLPVGGRKPVRDVQRLLRGITRRLSPEVANLLYVDGQGQLRLPRYTMIGSYPLLYVQRDGSILCADCAMRIARGEFDTSNRNYDVIGSQVHWEGAPYVCENCIEDIPSAYGDPAMQCGECGADTGGLPCARCDS